MKPRAQSISYKCNELQLPGLHIFLFQELAWRHGVVKITCIAVFERRCLRLVSEEDTVRICVLGKLPFKGTSKHHLFKCVVMPEFGCMKLALVIQGGGKQSLMVIAS